MYVVSALRLLSLLMYLLVQLVLLNSSGLASWSGFGFRLVYFNPHLRSVRLRSEDLPLFL